MNQNKRPHPLWVRWTHWINFPLLTLMVWSGLMIYWANRVYWPRIPDSFFNLIGLDHRLAEGMSYHFFFMWFFALNGLFYFIYIMISGEWRDIFPKRNSFKEALNVFLHDLGINKKLPGDEKFNGAQRIVYTLVIFMGFASLLSGLAIYKPIQVQFLKNLLGGYELARRIHFYLTLGFVLFFVVHIIQVGRAGLQNFLSMVGRSKASLAVLTVGLAFSIVGFFWLKSLSKVEGLPWPLRAGLVFNEKVWTKLLNPEKIDRAEPTSSVQGKKGRINGDLGLDSDDVAEWELRVVVPMTSRPSKEIHISLPDIKNLPTTEVITQFKCIEGWSEFRSFKGVKFSDFLNHYGLGTHSGEHFNLNKPDDLFRYVGT